MHRFLPGSLAVRPHPGQIATLGGRAAPCDVWFFKGLEWVLRSRLPGRPAASGPLRGLQSPRENPSALYSSSCEYVSLRSGRNEAHTASDQCCTPALGNSLFGPWTLLRLPLRGNPEAALLTSCASHLKTQAMCGLCGLFRLHVWLKLRTSPAGNCKVMKMEF